MTTFVELQDTSTSKDFRFVVSGHHLPDAVGWRGEASIVVLHTTGRPGWVSRGGTGDAEREFALQALTIDEAQQLAAALLNAVAEAEEAQAQTEGCEEHVGV